MKVNISKEKVEAFKWRCYNTFKSVILPVAIPIILVRMESMPNDLSILVSIELWESVAYAVIIALLGSIIAGIDKTRRV